jgi:hypothetical protein
MINLNFHVGYLGSQFAFSAPSLTAARFNFNGEIGLALYQQAGVAGELGVGRNDPGG